MNDVFKQTPEEFLKNIETYKRMSKEAKEYGESLIEGIRKEGWKVWQKEVCFKTFEEDEGIFCFGWSRNSEDKTRHGFIGVKMLAVDGVYKTVISCPLFSDLDCPLKGGKNEND